MTKIQFLYNGIVNPPAFLKPPETVETGDNEIAYEEEHLLAERNPDDNTGIHKASELATDGR